MKNNDQVIISHLTKKLRREELFTKDTYRSFHHLLVDILLLSGVVFLGFQIELKLTLTNTLLWLAYIITCGTVAMSLWVLAHECGHQAFTGKQRIDDFIGLILHSLLLVPYFAWQESHRIHHVFTNHIEKGESWVPSSELPTFSH